MLSSELPSPAATAESTRRPCACRHVSTRQQFQRARTAASRAHRATTHHPKASAQRKVSCPRTARHRTCKHLQGKMCPCHAPNASPSPHVPPLHVAAACMRERGSEAAATDRPIFLRHDSTGVHWLDTRLARHTCVPRAVVPKQDGSGSDSCPCVSERANPGCAGGRGLCVVSSRPRRAFGRGLRRARVRRSAPAAPAAACTSLAMRVCAHGQQCASLRRYRLAHWATDSGSAEHAFFDSSNPTHYEDTLPCLI